jgi:dTDP-4-amino-4,6-dideoxygalactose transaminase
VYGRESHIYNQYIISVPRDRDGLKRHLDEREVGNAIYYPVPFHQQECFAGLGYKTGEFPKAEFAAAHTLALPVYPEMTAEMRAFVVAAIKGYYA